ncbi:MAG: UrcA family protein [Pseudomonadota bacterium]
MIKLPLRGVLCAALLSTAAAANADTSVQYKASELSTEQGVAAVYERIRKSARKACLRAGGRDLKVVSVCRRDVTSELVANVANDRLTQFAQRNGMDKPVMVAQSS